MAEALPDTDRAILEDLAPRYAGSWTVNGGMSAAELSETVQWLYSTEDFAGLTPPELDAWIDFTPLDAALSELGTMEGLDPADR